MLKGFGWPKKYEKPKFTGGGALRCGGSSGSRCGLVFCFSQPVEKKTVITTVKKLYETRIEKGFIGGVL